MPTVNERLADAEVGHAVDLHQYSTGVVHRLIALLNRADAELSKALADALEQLPLSEFTVERLESLLLSVRQINARAYDAIGRDLTDELRKLAEYEAGYQLQLFQTVIPPQVAIRVGIAAVNVEQVYAAAMARPFQGVLLREALKGLEESKARLIRDQVRMGYIQQEPIPKIVQRLRGTKAKSYADGLWQRPRNDLEAVVRTAVSHTAGFVRDRFIEGNSDLVKAQVWTATLDSRTSEICRVRDGKQYEPVSPYKPIGHKLPWLGGPGRAHWCCRSTARPVTKSWRELGIDLPEMTPTTRASMDGQVSAELTFGDWLRKQSAARQDQVLGPTRAKLFRDGGLELERFYSDRGVYLTLDQLRERDAEAFKRAGV